MSDPSLEILQKETYLKAVENSIGSTQYRSLMVRYKDSGEVKDILEDGNLSCAYFVSSLLCLFGMIDRQRATVKSMLRFVTEDSAWSQVAFDDAAPGDVVFYTEREFADGSLHAHVGFVLSEHEAVSTSDTKRCVIKHSLTYHPMASLWRYSWK